MDLHPNFQSNVSASNPSVVNLRCPVCGKEGAFHGIGSVNDSQWNQHTTQEQAEKNVFDSVQGGVRCCPNQECKAVVFVIKRGGRLWKSYPAEVLDFDGKSLPEGVKACLTEAVLCHGNECYKASALMIRRTLEELCADQEATGKNLEKRIESLKGAIVIPGKLFDVMHELRFLGNDAAHIEAREYDDVGEPEARIAIRLTQELLKAVYQLDDLVAELTALKGT